MVAAAPVPGVALAVHPELTAELEQRAYDQATSIVAEGVKLERGAGFAPEPKLVSGDGVRACGTRS
jgi:hypothetical protein